MINIRQGVFETNSSSSHSFSINVATAGIYERIDTDPNDIDQIVLNGGDFSQVDFSVEDALEKANAIAVYCELTGNSKLMDDLCHVLCEQTGATRVITNIHLCGKRLNSWMSKEFAETLYGAVFDRKKIKDFIFNKSSLIEAGYYE